MNDLLMLPLSFLAGLALGGFFFGGLWWTVQHATRSANAALWFVGSFVVRLGVAVAGFFVVSGGHWQRLLLCVIGFTLARVAVVRLTRPSKGGTP